LEGVSRIVAHNAEFDLAVVEAECLRYNLPNPLKGKRVFCTKEESTEFCAIPGKWKGRPKWPSLGQLYQKLFESEVTEAHRANADVKTLVECYWGLKKALSVRE
jgi:DNA polymerase III epsilon subunit-like protein